MKGWTVRVPAEMFSDSRLNLREFRVLGALFMFLASKDGEGSVPRSALASFCGMSEQEVSRVTTSLQEKGWLVKVGDGGRSRPSIYRLFLSPKSLEGREITK